MKGWPRSKATSMPAMASTSCGSRCCRRAAFDMQQTDLAGETIDAGEDIALFADRIRARLGDNAVLTPVAVESHLPERAVVTVPFCRERLQRTKPPKSRTGRHPAVDVFRPERPVRLFRDPSRSRCGRRDAGRAARSNFRWRRALHRVAARRRAGAHRPGMVARPGQEDAADTRLFPHRG